MGGGDIHRERESKLVFYVQSTSAVISDREFKLQREGEREGETGREGGRARGREREGGGGRERGREGVRGGRERERERNESGIADML